VQELNWYWIVLELTVPPVAGILLAYPLWRSDQFILGNVAGTMVMFGSASGLILREHAEIDRAVRRCLDAGKPCWPEPSAFTRFAIYAFIALIEVFVLFTISLSVEQRRRRGDYAPEWQR
jgi:hypothetical protein